jgi:hypothetical protein
VGSRGSRLFMIALLLLVCLSVAPSAYAGPRVGCLVDPALAGSGKPLGLTNAVVVPEGGLRAGAGARPSRRGSSRAATARCRPRSSLPGVLWSGQRAAGPTQTECQGGRRVGAPGGPREPWSA